MHIVIDEVDGSFYADLIISPEEMKRIRMGEMISGEKIFRRRKCYVGIRLQGLWDYDEDETDSSEVEGSD